MSPPVLALPTWALRIGHQALDFFLRRDHRAVAALAEIVADLRKRRSRVLAGQIHRQHARMAHELALVARLQAFGLESKHVADGFLDIREPDGAALVEQLGQRIGGQVHGDRTLVRQAHGMQPLEGPDQFAGLRGEVRRDVGLHVFGHIHAELDRLIANNSQPRGVLGGFDPAHHAAGQAAK